MSFSPCQSVVPLSMFPERGGGGPAAQCWLQPVPLKAQRSICSEEKEWSCRLDQASNIDSKHFNYSSTNSKFIAVMTSRTQLFP